MADWNPRANELFIRAMEFADEQARREFLDRECGPDAALREVIESLLTAHEQAGQFLNKPHPAAADRTGAHISSETPTETAGTLIAGKYKLLQQIGEGGMGSVWMADQLEPVKRRVAVKLIRTEREGSKTILSRFEAERQAIALMDHPNIAKLLDAGTVGSGHSAVGSQEVSSPSLPTAHCPLPTDGRPFFVMELVKGIPLTEYCDEHKLSIPERLNLFTQICSAVQHAHQKGIIHRDLKPSNILVESHDNKPVPKVIDFGLAKAMSGQPLTENTLFTGFGTVAGTPLYMAPEQAKFNAIDIDTRADIYALGVILYELLTGSTPIERETLKKAALDEILRVVREQEPPTPSKRLSDLSRSRLPGGTLPVPGPARQAGPTIAALRQTEPAKLGRFVRGELDWIVMKALSKERDRRYETANGFAKDIERFLNHEPVLAGPPSVRYRLKKFVRRNRPQVIAGSLVILALVAGVVGTTAGLIRANLAVVAERNAKREAESEKKKAEQAEADTLADYRASTDDAIEHLIGSKPELGPQEKTYLENTLKRWQVFANRQGDDERSRAIRAEGHHRVGFLWSQLGRHEDARLEFQAARDIMKKLVEQFPAVPYYEQELAKTQYNLGHALMALGKLEEARGQYLEARDLQKELVERLRAKPDRRLDLANTHNGLGILLSSLGEHEEALAEYLAARDLQKNLVAQFPAVRMSRHALAITHGNMGNLLDKLGKREEARGEYQAARHLQKNLVEQFPDDVAYRAELARTHINLGLLLAALGNPEAARAEYESARDLARTLVEQFPTVTVYRRRLANAHNSLTDLLIELGKLDEARAECAAARDIRKKLAEQFPTMPEYQKELATTHLRLGNLLTNLGKPDEGRAEYQSAINILKKLVERPTAPPAYKKFLARTQNNLGQVLQRLGKREEALSELQMARDISKKLVEQFPDVPEYRYELALTQNALGSLLDDLGKREEARAEYQNARELRKQLVNRFPTVSAYQIDLGGSYCNHGILIRDEGKSAESLEWFALAIQTLKPVHDKEPRNVTAKLYLRNCYIGRAISYDRLQKFVEAVKDWGLAVELSPPTERAGFRTLRINSRVQAGQVAEAVAEVAEMTKSAGWNFNQLYHFACVYAVASGKIVDKKQEYANRAMELLKKAVKAGYKDAAHMKKDTDLDPLREREDFKKLLAELEKK